MFIVFTCLFPVNLMFLTKMMESMFKVVDLNSVCQVHRSVLYKVLLRKEVEYLGYLLNSSGNT